MDLFTMDKNFKEAEPLDQFESAIWTDRYYGNGDIELVVEPSKAMIQKLAKGTFVGLIGDTEPKIIDTLEITEDGKLKATGITLTEWLNNRFIRSSPDPAIKTWDVTGVKPGVLMTNIVQNWCIASVYLTNVWNVQPFWPQNFSGDVFAINPNSMGMLDSTGFKLPGLYIAESDSTGSNIDMQVPFGPIYDVLKAIGEAYEVGMKITLDSVSDDPDNLFTLGFHSYRGVDRSSLQTINPIVRFSPDLDNLINIKELQSIRDRVDVIFTYATQINKYDAVMWGLGVPHQTLGLTSDNVGFNYRVAMEYNEEIKPENIGGAPISEVPSSSWPGGDPTAAYNALTNYLVPGQRAYLKAHKGSYIVDGEIVQTDLLEYGRDFSMGDIIELEGRTGAIQRARVIEYIQSKDSSGERSYPTIALID